MGKNKKNATLSSKLREQNNKRKLKKVLLSNGVQRPIVVAHTNGRGDNTTDDTVAAAGSSSSQLFLPKIKNEQIESEMPKKKSSIPAAVVKSTNGKTQNNVKKQTTIEPSISNGNGLPPMTNGNQHSNSSKLLYFSY